MEASVVDPEVLEEEEQEEKKGKGKIEDQLAQIESMSAARTQVLGQGRDQVEYVQKPLSYFGKLEVIGVFGTAIDRALTEGLQLMNVFASFGVGPAGITGEGVIQGVGKLASYAPDLLLDLYTIWLNVPRQDRMRVRQLMMLPEDEGGLSDDDGIAIIETFIDQNAEVMVDFFNLRLKPLVERIRLRINQTQEDDEPQSSKPSKDTQQNTRKGSKNS